jgi:hypothetical protein
MHHEGMDIRRPSRSLIHPFVDFWLLGGASVVIWGLMILGQPFRHNTSSVNIHYEQLAATFAIMSLLCNHPHFIISYRFGYGRGITFILKNWFSLLAVPALLVALFTVAFLNYHRQIGDESSLRWINLPFEYLRLGYRFGRMGDWGTELLSLSIWAMMLTVGWHYAKQVFGCMMVYARYDNYALSGRQRFAIKTSVIILSVVNLISFSVGIASRTLMNPWSMYGITLTPIGLPAGLLSLSGAGAILSFAGVLYFVVYDNYRRRKQLPSANFLIPWIALHVWWIPLAAHPEFNAIAVPFFHSLQYLPFAYRVERGTERNIKFKAYRYPKLTLEILVLLVIGFLAFEFIPTLLNESLDTSLGQTPYFFTIAFAVFLNIHHFFIDSVSWRLTTPAVRQGLLTDPS